MKNIVIAGIPRSGKTTFANLVIKNFPKYDVVEVDKVKVSDLEKFERLIFEVDVMKNDSLINKLTKCQELGFIVLVFGYPNISMPDKVNEIIEHYSDDDLTYIESISDIKKFATNNISYSKKIKRLCDKNNILFVDTSKDRESVIQKLFLDIKNKIEEE